MSIKVGINGFGRMGRLTLRAAWGWPEIEFVQINDPAGDAATLAHLLNFDSVHGRWAHEASTDGDNILIGNQRIKTTRNTAIGDTDWSDCDVVIEASGKMRTTALLQAYLDQGVKRVVVVMEHTAKGKPKLLKRCTLPLTGTRVVDLVITDLGVFEIDKAGDGEMTLVEVAEGVTLDEIAENTEATYRVGRGR